MSAPGQVCVLPGALLALASLLFASGARAGEPADTDGERIYHEICAGCHMHDARGAHGAGAYPALAGNPALVSGPWMADVVLRGRRNMPAFGERFAFGVYAGPLVLSDAQIAAVVNYVRNHFGNHYTDPISAAEVATLAAAPSNRPRAASNESANQDKE